MSLTPAELIAKALQNITEVSVDEVKQQLGETKLLDVREGEEFAASHLPGAINIPRGVMEFKLAAHPHFANAQNEDIIVYCQSGRRSALAVDVLQQLGYSKTVSMAGGIKQWLDKGYDVE